MPGQLGNKRVTVKNARVVKVDTERNLLFLKGGVFMWWLLTIAVIGMACRFPGASDCRAYWRNLCRGVESIREFTPEELRERAWSDYHAVRAEMIRLSRELWSTWIPHDPLPEVAPGDDIGEHALVQRVLIDHAEPVLGLEHAGESSVAHAWTSSRGCAYRATPLISAIAITGALVLPLTSVGMMDASTTRRPPENQVA